MWQISYREKNNPFHAFCPFPMYTQQWQHTRNGKSRENVPWLSLSTSSGGSWGKDERRQLQAPCAWEVGRQSWPGVLVKVETKQNNFIFPWMCCWLQNFIPLIKHPGEQKSKRHMMKWTKAPTLVTGEPCAAKWTPGSPFSHPITSPFCNQVQTQSQHRVSLQIVY